jgi:hypothetical protein
MYMYDTPGGGLVIELNDVNVSENIDILDPKSQKENKCCTEATLRAQFDTTQFVHVAESDLECASMRMSTTMVGSVTIGDVLVGSSLCGFCSVGDDMASHACVAHVVAIGRVRLTAVDDVWSLPGRVD